MDGHFLGPLRTGPSIADPIADMLNKVLIKKDKMRLGNRCRGGLRLSPQSIRIMIKPSIQS